MVRNGLEDGRGARAHRGRGGQGEGEYECVCVSALPLLSVWADDLLLAVRLCVLALLFCV